MTKFEQLLRGLVAQHVRFVLVGGLAAIVHGASSVTDDLDIVYERSKENVHRLVRYLKTIHAVLRDAPTDLPFVLDEKTFGFGMNFTFQTDLGALDLLGEIAGLGKYPDVFKHAESFDLYGLHIDVLSLTGLIQSKKATGRTKDLLHLKELEALAQLKPH